jgi:hypothetical protein
MPASLQNSTQKLAETTKTIEKSTVRVEDSADRRTEHGQGPTGTDRAQSAHWRSRLGREKIRVVLFD